VAESLRRLLQRCRDGEEDSIAELVRRFQPWALDFATAVLRDRDEAEDAVQEAFLTALDRLPDLRDPEAFPAWLRQIIRTHGSRAARRRRDLPLDDQAEQAGREESALSRMEREELARKVREAVAALPPAGRETVVMFYIDDMKCSQIAGQLGVPQGTVKRRLHDARERLRAMLLGYVMEGEPPGRSEVAPNRWGSSPDPMKGRKKWP
jgi:RNA polymerase sigma factor (sigma-70 family)